VAATPTTRRSQTAGQACKVALWRYYPRRHDRLGCKSKYCLVVCVRASV